MYWLLTIEAPSATPGDSGTVIVVASSVWMLLRTVNEFELISTNEPVAGGSEGFDLKGDDLLFEGFGRVVSQRAHALAGFQNGFCHDVGCAHR
ncbi:hypothetical protein MAUB1S_11387 [Mycolicibacterium aubagnense]